MPSMPRNLRLTGEAFSRIKRPLIPMSLRPGEFADQPEPVTLLAGQPRLALVLCAILR